MYLVDFIIRIYHDARSSECQISKFGLENSIIILNNVRQHKCFIIQGSYIGYMFRLIDQSSSGLLSRLSFIKL